MSERLKIAVCDDEARAISVISASVESTFQDLGREVLLEKFLSPQALLERLQEYSFDLIFTDISMPGMDGIQLAGELKKLGKKSALIFVSSRTDRVFDTFAVQPFGFVRKSNFLEDIGEVIGRFVSSGDQKDDDRYFYLKDQQGTIAIDVAHVTYIECIRNMQILHFDDSREEYRLYSRMGTLEEEMKKYDFIRVHKGFLVSCRFIRRFESKAVILTTEEEIPVGRSHHHEAMDAYLDFISRTGDGFIGK